MVNMLINHKHNLIRLLKQTFSDARGNPQADEEYLVMLASGRYFEIPQPERYKLLSAIAGNPGESALLRDLYHLNKVQQSASRMSTTYRIMALGWGIAACLMIGTFVSRVIDPPRQGIGVQTITPYGTEAEPDYWSQLDKQRLSMQAKWHAYRDIALILSTVACLVLSIGLIWSIRDRRRLIKKENGMDP